MRVEHLTPEQPNADWAWEREALELVYRDCRIHCTHRKVSLGGLDPSQIGAKVDHLPVQRRSMVLDIARDGLIRFCDGPLGPSRMGGYSELRTFALVAAAALERLTSY
jgi:hypothetical protein